MSCNETKRGMSRRQLLRVLARGTTAAGLGALITACGGSAAPQAGEQSNAAQSNAAQSNTSQDSAQSTPQSAAQAPAQSSGGGTTIQFITPAALGAERDLYTSFVNNFQKDNPKIKVNVSFEAWNDYMTKLPTIFASGAVPDMIHQHMSIVQDYGARGALLDLTPLMQRDGVAKEDYIPALFESFSNEGVTYALPKDSAAWGIYYNKAMFDAAKLPYPKDDWTLDDFAKYVVELTLDNNGNSASSPKFDGANVKQWGFNWLEPTPTTSEITRGFVKAYGGDWYNEQYTETLITDPKVQAYFKLMADMRCKQHASPAASQAQAQGDPFRTGLVAMVHGFHSTDYFCRQEKVTFPWDVTFIPSGAGGQFVPVGASGWAIPAKASNPDAAWELVKYLTSAEVQKTIGEQKRWGLSRKEAIDSIIPENPVSGFKKVHVDPLMGKSDRTVISFKFPAKQSQIKQVYTTEFDAVWTCGSDDISSAAEAAKQQIDEILQS